MNLLSDSFLFLDCQSTGANPQIGNLLELAWCQASALDSEPGNISGLLIKQPDDQQIPFRVQMITGITDAEMQEAVAPTDAYQALIDHLRSTNSGGKAIVHYASFERAFLHNLFEKHDDRFPYDLVCTFQIARRLYPNLPTRGIRGLGGFFGASDRQLKRSSHHVETTWSIWRGLVTALNERGILTISQLEEWLSEPFTLKKGKYQYPLPQETRLALPNTPGVYKMLNKKGEVLYVGKATSLKSRVNSYFRGQKNKDSRKLEMATQTHDIAYIECGSALEAALFESDEIKKHNPPYNESLKTRSRALCFFSADLYAISRVQTEEFPVGPFSSPFVLEQFARLYAWLITAELDPLIFHGEVSDELIGQGFELFCQTEAIDPSTIVTARDLMALAVKLLRRQPTLTDEVLEYEGDGVDEDALLDDAEVLNANDLIPNFTPEEVAGKFGRLLKRAGKAYVRAKVMTRLLNCSLIFQEKSKIRKLKFADGIVVPSQDCSEQVASYVVSTRGSSPWSEHQISTYDRLSVLIGEIIRLQMNNQGLLIEPHVPLNLVSRRIV